MRKTSRLALLIAVVVLVVVGLWEATYPNEYDPKNVHYVLCKSHLVSINLERAVSVMQHDRSSEQMILGKNQASLTSRFGYLLTPETASQCYRASAREAAANGDKVFFLRNSDYMIVFHNDVAIRLVLLNTASPC